jgi:hypothetical protein
MAVLLARRLQAHGRLEKGSQSNLGCETYFTLRVSHGPSPVLQFTALSPRFSLLLLFYKVVEYNGALIYVEGPDLPPVTYDHKI